MTSEDRTARIAMLIFTFIITGGITTAIIRTMNNEEKGGQSVPPIVEVVEQPVDACLDPKDTDTLDVLQLKLDLCRASLKFNQRQLQKLNDQAHDEFDMEE